MVKEIHTESLNFSVTGTVHLQLSPKSPRRALPAQARNPGMIPLSIPYVALSCSIHSSKLLDPGCMDFCLATCSK